MKRKIWESLKAKAQIIKFNALLLWNVLFRKWLFYLHSLSYNSDITPFLNLSLIYHNRGRELQPTVAFFKGDCYSIVSYLFPKWTLFNWLYFIKFINDSYVNKIQGFVAYYEYCFFSLSFPFYIRQTIKTFHPYILAYIRRSWMINF